MTKTHKGRKGVPAPEPTPVADPAVRRPAWLTTGSLGLAVIGLLVSAYLTYEHFSSSATLACPEGQTINCAKVTESSYAMFLGMPVAVLGLLYFVAVVALCLPAAWARPSLDMPRLALLALGTVMVLYLVWAELFGIGAICLWCTVVHVITVVLLGMVLVGWAVLPRR